MGMSAKLALLASAVVAMLGSDRQAWGAGLLLPISSTPYEQLYRVFYVVTEGSPSRSQIAVVPNKLEFERDAAGKAKFGIQYLFEPGTPRLVQLTGAIKFYYDKGQVTEILEYVRNLETSTPPLVSVSLGNFSFITFFFNDMVASISVQQITPNSVPIEAPVAVSLDLSKLGKDELKSLVDAPQSSGGFIGVLTSSSPIVALSNDNTKLASLVKWALQFSVLTVTELQRPKDPLASRELEIRTAISSTLGAPELLKTSDGYAFGWNMQLQANRAKLEQLIAASSKGTLRKVSNEYRAETLFTLGSVCKDFPSQIVNLTSFETGCAGLTK